jgi:hypothetical protein
MEMTGEGWGELTRGSCAGNNGIDGAMKSPGRGQKSNLVEIGLRFNDYKKHRNLQECGAAGFLLLADELLVLLLGLLEGLLEEIGICSVWLAKIE